MTTGPTPAFMKQITFLMARGPEPEGRRVHGKAVVRKVRGDRFRLITDMRWDHVDSFITGNRAVTPRLRRPA